MFNLLLESKYNLLSLILSFTSGITFILFVVTKDVWLLVGLICFLITVVIDTYLFYRKNKNYCPNCGINLYDVKSEDRL